MVRAALLASLLITVGATDSAQNREEATALLQSRNLKTKGLDDDDVGSCAGQEGHCADRTSMSGKCLRKQPLWNFPWGYWNCNRAAKYCKHNLWKFDVFNCCPGVCTNAELYNGDGAHQIEMGGSAPQWLSGGITGEATCEATNATCTDCAGQSTKCLQARDHWTPKHTCENSRKYCHGYTEKDKEWSKDMQECCPGVCSTAADANGACTATGCSASDETCTDCTDNSDRCLNKARNKNHGDYCKRGFEKGWCNKKDKMDDMLKCCPGYCEAQPDPANGGQCARLGSQASDATVTDCTQNSDKCIAKRRGDKWVCNKAKRRGMCTRAYSEKNGRTWMKDMLECCPGECGAQPDAEGTCAYSGCQASDQHCNDCNDISDRCMQEYKNSHKWTCKHARDRGYCSIRDGHNWDKRQEAMNNCCPGICKGPFPETDMIPEWAICRGGSGKDEEEPVEGGVDPAEPADGDDPDNSD